MKEIDVFYIVLVNIDYFFMKIFTIFIFIVLKVDIVKGLWFNLKLLYRIRKSRDLYFNVNSFIFRFQF